MGKHQINHNTDHYAYPFRHKIETCDGETLCFWSEGLTKLEYFVCELVKTGTPPTEAVEMAAETIHLIRESESVD